MTFGLQCDEPGSIAILDKAAEAGINFLDTADAYPLGGELTTVGRTEEIIGRWLSGRRDDFVLATKCFGITGTNPWDAGMSSKHIHQAIDASLRRLGTDYVDLYQLHFDDPLTPLDETLGALDDLVRSGKVRYLGVSNWSAWRLARAIGRTELNKTAPIVSVQPRYNLLFRSFERDLFRLTESEGVGVISYNPLAGGLLTGKHQHDAGPGGGRFAIGTTAQMYKDRYWHPDEFATVDELLPLAEEAGISLARLSIGWVLAKSWITSPIIGASQPWHLDDALAAAADPLDPAIVSRADEITAKWRKGDAER
jgi:aryl-alcohol dehydrogenase (NADP+)